MEVFNEVYKSIDENISTNGSGSITGEKLHNTFYDIVHASEAVYNEFIPIIEKNSTYPIMTFTGVYNEFPTPKYNGQLVIVNNIPYVSKRGHRGILEWIPIDDRTTRAPIRIYIPSNTYNNTNIYPKDLNIFESDLQNIVNGTFGNVIIRDNKFGYFGNANIIVKQTNDIIDYIKISYFADIEHSYILQLENNDWKIYVK